MIINCINCRKKSPEESSGYSSFLLYLDSSISSQNNYFANDLIVSDGYWRLGANNRIIPLKTFQVDVRSGSYSSSTSYGIITFKKGLKYSTDSNCRNIYEEGISIINKSDNANFYMHNI